MHIIGTFLSVGIKLPYFIWFGEDSGVPAKDPPWNMVLAMGIAAFFVVHIAMVILAGPLNEIRSMITGRYRLPEERT